LTGAISAQIAHLQTWLPQFIERTGITGLSLALIDEARIVWAQGFGLESVTTGQPVTPETVFEAASLTKPVFAYAVLKLCEMGALNLDIPLTDYLPEPYLPNEPRLPLITPRLILSHTPGFPNWRKEGEPLKIFFTPGQRFSYSGEGYVYLQRVVEHVTGQPLAEYLAETVLKPLEMRDSSLIWTEALATQAAQGHDLQGEPVETRKATKANAAYSLHSTPSDFARFMISLLEPPAQDKYYLSTPSIAAMLRPEVQVNDLAPWRSGWPDLPVTEQKNVAWGLGWGLQELAEGEISFWHWGDNGSFQALALGFKDQAKGVVLMSNSERARPIWKEVAREIFGGDYPALNWLYQLYDQT
jgi:CubicO group peptidase (beta-lactamase class C family)